MKVPSTLLGIAVLSASMAATSQVPDSFAYQAFVTDKNTGEALNENVSVSFSILDASTNNTVWSSSATTVAVANGLLSTEFGPVPQDVFSTSELSLRVTIDGETLPAQPLNSVPFARAAEQLSPMPGGDEDGVVGLTPIPGTSWQSLASLQATIATSGRPVLVGLADAGADSGNPSYVRADEEAQVEPRADVRFLRDGEVIAVYRFDTRGDNNRWITIPSSAFSTVDFVGAGTHTYTVEARVDGGGDVGQAINARLYAVEL